LKGIVVLAQHCFTIQIGFKEIRTDFMKVPHLLKGRFRDDIRINTLSNAAQDGYECEAQFFLSATLAQTFNNRFSALTGAAITVLALAEPFIAAGAAVAFWFFFATEKELGPRGYERNEIIKCLVGTTKHKKHKIILE
jgi:hypothetical protein